MPSPRKLVVYLVGGLSVFAALTGIFRDRLVGGFIFVFLGCVVLHGLIEGEVFFGRGAARKTYRRRSKACSGASQLAPRHASG